MKTKIFLIENKRSILFVILLTGFAYFTLNVFSFDSYSPLDKSDCNVSIQATNTEKSSKIRIGWFSVKIKGGTLEDKEPSETVIDYGKIIHATVSMDFGCDINRQYRIHLIRSDYDETTKSWSDNGDYFYYYPSDKSWTKKTSINLGDVSRFFKN